MQFPVTPRNGVTPFNAKALHRALKNADHSISTSAAHGYIQSLQKSYCNTYEKIVNLSEEDMRELNVPIGHRAAIIAAANDCRENVGLLSQLVSDPSLQSKIGSGGSNRFEAANNNRWISLRGKANQFRAFAMTMHAFATKNGFTTVSAEDVRGISDMSGKDYLPVDLSTVPDLAAIGNVSVKDGHRGLHMPTSVAGNDFMKLFDPSQQMPIVVCHASARTFGLRIRVPDLECVRDADRGANIQDITNRICFLVKDAIEVKSKDPNSATVQTPNETGAGFRDKPGGLVLTFDACDEDPLRHFYNEEWCTGEFNGNGVDEVVAEMILAVLQLYSEGVRILREQVDELDDPRGDKRHTYSDADLVRAYATTSKRAAVFRRCAEATRDAIGDLGDRVHWMRSHCIAINDAIGSIVVAADEVASNAGASMELTIALSDFAGNHNMKLFTYVTILLQPVAVGTGWYGMNWTNLPELSAEHGYRNFALVIWAISLALLLIVARVDIWNFISTVWWQITKCCSGRSSSQQDEETTMSEPVKDTENPQLAVYQ